MQGRPYGYGVIHVANSESVVHVQLRLHLEVAADGVQIRANTNASTQIFVVKCKDMLGDYIGKSANVKPLLIVPGPEAPRSYDVYWYLILQELFVKYGPRSAGVCIRTDSCAQAWTGHPHLTLISPVGLLPISRHKGMLQHT